MNNIKISILFSIIIFILNSCGNNEKESLFEETFLIVTHKVVEKFNNDKLVNKTIFDYYYDRKNDFFWNKIEVKDSSGKIIRIIKRNLDKSLRLPTDEIIIENNIIVSKKLLKYSIDNYELLFEIEFENGDKINSKYINYNELGYLISQSDTIFNKGKIRKIESINYLPSIAKPKGYFPIYGITGLKKVYQADKIDTFFITKYDKLNYPLFDSLYQSGNSHINWYKVVVDDGKTIGLISYEDKSLKILSAENNELKFDYDSNGNIEKIEDLKYNTLSGEFDIINNIQTFKWIIPKFKSRYNFADYNYTKISNCNKKEHTKYEKKIVRFDDVGKKVVEEYLGTFEGDCSEDTEVKTELIKRTTYVFNKLVIKGETAVIYKNKKTEKEFENNK